MTFCSLSVISLGTPKTATCPRPPSDAPNSTQHCTDLQAAASRGDVARPTVVIVGSYVPEGVEVGKLGHQMAQGVTAFYDIDTPVTLAKLERGDTNISARLIPHYDLYLSFTGGPTLELLGRNTAPRAHAFYCSVDPDALFPRDAETRWDLGYLGTYSADRQPTVEACSWIRRSSCRSNVSLSPGRSIPHHSLARQRGASRASSVRPSTAISTTPNASR